MFALKRNQVIITALVIMICVAGYLNYIDSQNDLLTDGMTYDLTSNGEISAIVLDNITGQEVQVINTSAMNNEIPPETTGQEEINNDNNENEPGTAVFVNANNDSSFFVQAKLNREQDRAKQKESLTTIINSKEVDENTRALSADTILKISDRMESENAAEAALKAKGFGDSYVRIDDDWVEVIITKSVLTDQELAQLEEIITRHTGATVDTMRVSSVKGE